MPINDGVEPNEWHCGRLVVLLYTYGLYTSCMRWPTALPPVTDVGKLVSHLCNLKIPSNIYYIWHIMHFFFLFIFISSIIIIGCKIQYVYNNSSCSHFKTTQTHPFRVRTWLSTRLTTYSLTYSYMVDRILFLTVHFFFKVQYLHLKFNRLLMKSLYYFLFIYKQNVSVYIIVYEHSRASWGEKLWTIVKINNYCKKL